MRLTDHCAQALAGRSSRGVAVGEARSHVGHARALVERDQLNAAVRAFAIGADEDFSAAAMLENIGGKLGRHESDPAAVGSVKPLAPRHLGCPSPRLRYLALVLHGESNHRLLPTCDDDFGALAWFRVNRKFVGQSPG